MVILFKLEGLDQSELKTCFDEQHGKEKANSTFFVYKIFTTCLFSILFQTSGFLFEVGEVSLRQMQES